MDHLAGLEDKERLVALSDFDVDESIKEEFAALGNAEAMKRLLKSLPEEDLADIEDALMTMGARIMGKLGGE